MGYLLSGFYEISNFLKTTFEQNKTILSKFTIRWVFIAESTNFLICSAKKSLCDLFSHLKRGCFVLVIVEKLLFAPKGIRRGGEGEEARVKERKTVKRKKAPPPPLKGLKWVTLNFYVIMVLRFMVGPMEPMGTRGVISLRGMWGTGKIRCLKNTKVLAPCRQCTTKPWCSIKRCIDDCADGRQTTYEQAS